MDRKKIVAFSSLFLVFFSTAMLLWFRFGQKTFSSNKYLLYDEFNGEWQETIREPITNDYIKNEDNGFYNDSLIRGFFDHYEEKTDTLYVKSAVPFGQQLFEIKSIKVGLQQSFYCTPSQVVNNKTGETKLTSSYRFPVKDGETLYTYYENNITVEDFFSKAKKDTWVFIQLTGNYSKTQENYLYKLVAVGLCE